MVGHRHGNQHPDCDSHSVLDRDGHRDRDSDLPGPGGSTGEARGTGRDPGAGPYERGRASRLAQEERQ